MEGFISARTRAALVLAVLSISVCLSACSGGSTEDRDVNGTELSLGPIQSSSQSISPDSVIELSAYAQIGTSRGSSLTFPERPLLWQASAGTFSLDRNALSTQNAGDWTDATEVSAGVGQKVYWRAPQQKGTYSVSVKMADLTQQAVLGVVSSLPRMEIESPTLYYALGEITVPPTSLKPNQIVEIEADAEVLVYGLPPVEGTVEHEKTWHCSAGRLAETSSALQNLGSGPELMNSQTLTTRRAGKIFYRTPPQAGVYFITIDFHRMQQEALVFVVQGP